MNYVFDVDGTLTPSRGQIDPEFKTLFHEFCQHHSVFLLTGSDYNKTLEQVGKEITHTVRAVYNCAGNAIYVKGQLVFKNDFVISDDLRAFLKSLLDSNKYSTKTGIHIEDRIGLCNFSIVGRNASKKQRADYVEYDLEHQDRRQIVNLINSHFPKVQAVIGGETGVDIYQVGKDKSQVSEVLHPYVFFGDSIYPGGNDYTVAQKAEKCYNVKHWKEVSDILKSLWWVSPSG